MSYTKKRFWEKVAVSSSCGCWLWLGHKHKVGHGQFYYKGRAHYAHRISWLLTFGEILEGFCILHRCDNPWCVNPWCVNPFHLFIGTQQQNVVDMIEKGRMAYGEKRSRKGEANGVAKLCANDILMIRKLRENGDKLIDIAEIFGVSEARIGQIVNGKAWKHVT